MTTLFGPVRHLTLGQMMTMTGIQVQLKMMLSLVRVTIVMIQKRTLLKKPQNEI